MEYRDDKLTESIIAGVIRVHQELGPGFLESIYQKALLVELSRKGLRCDVEKEVPVYYSGVEVGLHRVDLLIEGRIVVELKTVQDLNALHYSQVRSYLKACRLRVGLLVNFSKLHADYRRVEF